MSEDNDRDEIRHEDLTPADIDHMRKVVEYVHRHLKQGGPKGDEKHPA